MDNIEEKMKKTPVEGKIKVCEWGRALAWFVAHYHLFVGAVLR